MAITDQNTLDLLRQQAEIVMKSDMFPAKYRRTIKRIDKNDDVYEAFNMDGTLHAILAAMIEAVEQGKEPVSAVRERTITPDPATEQIPDFNDEITTAQLAAAAPAEKPDFNTLKRTFSKPEAQVERETAAARNADIAEQETTLLAPRVGYEIPEVTPEPTPAPIPTPAPTPEPEKKKPPKPKKPLTETISELEGKLATS